MNEFVVLSKKFPPRCLNAFKHSFIEDVFNEFTSAFKIECGCGSRKFALVGDEELGMSPVQGA